MPSSSNIGHWLELASDHQVSQIACRCEVAPWGRAGDGGCGIDQTSKQMLILRSFELDDRTSAKLGRALEVTVKCAYGSGGKWSVLYSTESCVIFHIRPMVLGLLLCFVVV